MDQLVVFVQPGSRADDRTSVRLTRQKVLNRSFSYLPYL